MYNTTYSKSRRIFGLDDLAAAGIISAGIGGLTSAVGSIFSSKNNRASTREANATNIALQREQQDWNEKMWSMNNAYNDPSAQMGRLRAAGLNPNMVYSSGQMMAGNAAGMPSSVQPAHVVPEDFSGIERGFNVVGQIFKEGAELGLLKSQIAKNNAEAGLADANTSKVEGETLPPGLRFQYWNDKVRIVGSQADMAANEATIKEIDRALAEMPDYNTFRRAILAGQSEKLAAEIDDVNAQEFMHNAMGLSAYIEAGLKDIYGGREYEAKIASMAASAGYYGAMAQQVGALTPWLVDEKIAQFLNAAEDARKKGILNDWLENNKATLWIDYFMNKVDQGVGIFSKGVSSYRGLRPARATTKRSYINDGYEETRTFD